MVALESLPELIAKIRAWEFGRGPITVMVGACEVFRQQREEQRVPDLDIEAMTKWMLDAALGMSQLANTIVMIRVGDEAIYCNRFGHIEVDDLMLGNH